MSCIRYDPLTAYVTPIIAQAKADPNILAGSGAAQMLKSLEDNIVVAQGSLKNARATLVGTEQLLSVYIEAGRELQRTYAQCRSELAQKQATLTNAELTYQHQDQRVKEFMEQIDFCTIRAKAPGLVIYGEEGSADALRGMRGKGIIAEGENVWE